MSSLQRTKTGWRVQWIDGQGTRRTRTLRTKDRRAAERFGSKMESEAAMLRAGLVDSTELQAAESARQLISEALDEWKVEQRRTNRTPQHTGKTVQQIERLCSLANWEKLVDINADSMQIALDDIRAHGGKAPKGEVRRASARTVQAYVRAAKGFTRWCVRNGKLVADPLTNVAAPNPQSDRKHVRRAMTRGEWQVLREYLCKETEPRRGVEPEQRAMLYELLILTGYRKEEFRQLRVSSLQTVAGRAQLILDSQHTKNCKAAHQLISEATASRLRKMLAGCKPTDPLLSMPEQFGVVRMLRADLEAARARWIKKAKKRKLREERAASDFLSYEDHQGRKLDIHALRHTCGAWLAEAGIQPKVIQQVMRHASITTTFDLYGHLMPGMMEDAVEQLAGVLG